MTILPQKFAKNKKLKIFIFAALILSGIILLSAHHASAQFACSTCAGEVTGREVQEWDTPGIGAGAGTGPRLEDHFTTERTAQQIWTASILWEDNILPALMLMAEEMTAVAMKQAELVGAFLDAKNQMETQQVFQRLAARAHKDYHPSTGMCEFGSGAKSLAASERRGELTAILLSQRSQDRNLGNANQAAATGEDGDKLSRLKQFREKFCDPRDNNDGLGFLCEHDQDQNLATGQIGAANPERMNKDIDYVRTMDAPWTLNMDFTNTAVTNNEEEVMALANNLYGNEVFFRPPGRTLESEPASSDRCPDANNCLAITSMQKHYLDARSVIAKRSVAENSFNAIAAMKASGTPGSRDYLVELMKQLISPTPTPEQLADIDKMLGENPSYYAQMEVLTKKIFQNPDFFTNLYDTPANVDRKAVAIQAIGLMQKFDLYKSYLRNEASLSVLLELSVQDLQDEIENEFNAISGEGTPAKP